MARRQGELLFTENFGNNTKKWFSNKPGDQDIFVVRFYNKNTVTNWFTRIFLPQGYPVSVSKDYLEYQIWDTAQAFCSTISGILATQEVLRGVGVGDENATPLAATITWVLKDGCGHIGKIVFAFTHGKYLDAYSKKWRLYADILNNVAMCIEMMLPYFKVYSLSALCLSTVCRAIVGVAGGATRVAMTQHHAKNNNLADVSAKDAAQETAVNLVASLVSLLIITYLGNYFIIFTLMIILHIMFNYWAVKAVCLRTMNETRFLLVIENYLRFQYFETPEAINKIEPIIEPITFYNPGGCVIDYNMCGFKIKLGSSLYHAFGSKLKTADVIELREIYNEKAYIPVVNMRHLTVHVVLKLGANTDDILCSYFHAVLLAYVICALNNMPLVVTKIRNPHEFVFLSAILKCLSWCKKETHVPESRVSYRPSAFLQSFLNAAVAKEWPEVRKGLMKNGKLNNSSTFQPIMPDVPFAPLTCTINGADATAVYRMHHSN